MGCWNGTCFLSNMSILHGDPIRLQLILSSTIGKSEDSFDPKTFTEEDDPREINGICNVNDIYSPWGFAISGKYSDYGSIEEIEDNTASRILKLMLKDYVKRGKILMKQDVDKWLNKKCRGEGKNNKPYKNIDVDDLEKFINAVERGQVVVQTFRGAWMTLRFVMAAEPMYQRTLQLADKTDYGWHDKTIGDYLRTFGEAVIRFYTSDLAAYSKFLAENKKLLGHEYDTFERMSKYIAEQNASMKSKDMNIMIEMVTKESLWRPFSRDGITWHDVTDVILDTFKDADEAAKREIIGVNVERTILASMMSKLRLPWQIPCGCGSQDDNLDAVKAHAKNMIAAVKDVEKIRKIRYGE